MPGCAAIGCNNRSEKGYSMKCFPRDPLLRQIWKEKVGRANWEPSKNSFLCHDHFEQDQWAGLENGRVRLKRDAMPSIFEETSKRKSPRKRRLDDGKKKSHIPNKGGNTIRVSAVKVIDDESEDDNYTLEYLDDCEYEVAFASGGNTPKTSANSSANVAYHIVSEKDIKGLEKENIIIVSDENNKEIGKLIHNNESIIIVADENNKEIGQIVVDDDLLGQHNSVRDNNQQQQESYDEIEERLKQICNGEDVTVTLTTGRKEIDCRNLPLVKREGNNEIENWTTGSTFDKEIPTSMKIIFGTESREESKTPSNNNSLQKNPAHKTSVEKNEAPKNTSKGKEQPKALGTGSGAVNRGSLDTPLRKGETNIRAPLKRQKKSREDVIGSIEKAIAELSERTLQSVQNDQLTQSALRFARARKKGNIEKGSAYKRPLGAISDMFQLDDCNSSSKKSKFTIKVTGVADDVNEIMEGLETSSMRIKTESNRGENLSPKYVVAEEINEQDLRRIDSRFIKGQERSMASFKSEQELSSDFDSIDFAKGCILQEEIHQQYAKSSRNQILNVRHGASNIETLFKRNREFIHTEEFDTKIQRKKLSSKEMERIVIEGLNSEDENNRSMRLKYFSKLQDPSRELRHKIRVQQEVIGKLTNQLIIYKSLEAKLATLSCQLQVKTKEIQLLKDKLEKKPHNSAQGQAECKKNSDVKDKTISDLSNKINRLTEANRKLTQQITSESQIKKSAYHMKQKDDQIKELRWKLEKASKFLERAEKNANTYKRKMVSMQTAIRRQKASDEKRNHFQELLIDNAKHEFSESALITAMDIKNTCGVKCYQKLLSYNFPLPSLRTLRRRFQKENVAEEDWGEEDQDQVANVENTQIAVANKEISQSNELGESEVTGTVQDIFEENNDNEELNSCELGEQIFLQIKNDKKFADT